jgi:TrmH family RNA methyltransferase
MTVIRSRDNSRVKRWSKLMRDSSLRNAEKRAMIEGPHLVAELLQAGLKPLALLASESGLERDEIQNLIRKQAPVILADGVFRAVADADSPPGIAAEIEIPQRHAEPSKHCVFLEGVQDPSNVGAIVRSAAAFDVGELVLDRSCADAWAPKVLRAAMGGHFKLGLRQVSDLRKELKDFAGTLVCTIPKGGLPLRQALLEGRLGWIFGAEGQGVSAVTAEQAATRVTIPMHQGTESLNVAAAAAICLYETFSRRGGES